ncbi:hypothetical protein AeNC1_012758 [Aphanomyces euteiches]|nr:hypothetical protein AeNC1_012758 [Aphanomyces euteiches]
MHQFRKVSHSRHLIQLVRWPCRQMSIQSQLEDVEGLRELGRESDRVTLYLSGDDRTPFTTSLTRTAVVELSNPTARNAMSGKMMAEFMDAVKILEEQMESLNCVVVCGHERHFCAGADLRVAKEHLSLPEGGATMSRVMTDALTRLRRLPLVSVAVIEGAAMGGGAELATACDFRLVSQSSTIQFVHARMGISPAWGGASRLVGIVGRQKALRLLGRVERLNATAAKEMGLADEIIDDKNVTDEVLAFLKPLDAHTPDVLHAIKEVVSDDAAIFNMLPKEHDVFQRLWGGPANLAALATSSKPKKTP